MARVRMLAWLIGRCPVFHAHADAKDLLLMSAEEEDQAAVDDVAAEVERLREA